MGRSGRRFMEAADVRPVAVSGHRQLFATGSDTDLADLCTRARPHLTGRHSIHPRDQRPRLRRAAQAVDALGYPESRKEVRGITQRHEMPGITRRHTRSRRTSRLTSRYE